MLYDGEVQGVEEDAGKEEEWQSCMGTETGRQCRLNKGEKM